VSDATLVPRPRRDERTFLGEEWLTWLWCRAESGDATFDLGGGRSVGIAIDAPLLLRAPQEDEAGRRPEQALRNGRPLGGAEAAAALRAGKRLVRARLIVAEGGREWTATFDAETFSLRSVRVPESEEEESADRANDHVAAFQDLVLAIDGVYREFLLERLAPDLRKKSVLKMRRWVAEKNGAA